VVGIFLGVELVHQRRLLVGGAGGGGRLGAEDGITVGGLVVLVDQAVVAVAHVGALGATVEGVDTLLAAAQDTATLLELVDADGGEGGSLVVLGLVVVNLVHWLSGVDDVWLDGLLVHDRLDLLVDVVVHVFSTNGGLDGTSRLALHAGGLVVELCGLTDMEVLVLGVVAMLELTVLNVAGTVVVLLRQDFLVVDRLYGSVVVVLVNFLVDRWVNSLLLLLVNSLVGDSWVHALVDLGVVLAILADKALNCVFCGLHFEWWLGVWEEMEEVVLWLLNVDCDSL